VVCTKTEVRWRPLSNRLERSLVANICHKEINFDTLKAKFCGPGKPISKAQFQELDRKIEEAKNSGDEKVKKQLKLEYV